MEMVETESMDEMSRHLTSTDETCSNLLERIQDLLDNMGHQQEMSEISAIIADEEAGEKQIALFFIDSTYEEDLDSGHIEENSQYQADPEFYYQMHKEIEDI